MNIFENYLRECLLINLHELLHTIKKMPQDLESIPADHPDHKLKQYAELLRRFEHDGIHDVTEEDIGNMLVDAMYQLLPDEIMI